MKIIYRTYQLLIAFPILLIATVLCAITVIVMCPLGGREWRSFWGYYPPKVWSCLMCWVLLIRVKVEGHENIDTKTSYVFVANHQGPYDIFAIYGFLGHRFLWMMKRELAEIPLVGMACRMAGHILVDRRGPKAIKHTQDSARRALTGGKSLVIFPEGSRTFTGHMAPFRRGAFQLGHELQLPIVPVTIDGSFDVLPRQKGFYFVNFHTIRIVIQKPIPYREDMNSIISEAFDAVHSQLPLKYQGIVENPDQ